MRLVLPKKESVIQSLINDDIDTILHNDAISYLEDILRERYEVQSYTDLVQELKERKGEAGE